jgi:hypothetical protein
MRVSLKSFALSSAILWGGAMLFVGLIHLAAPAYGADFLRIMSSVYPGADTSRTLGSVLLGTAYGFVDGGIGGLLFGLLYSAFSGGTHALLK